MQKSCRKTGPNCIRVACKTRYTLKSLFSTFPQKIDEHEPLTRNISSFFSLLTTKRGQNSLQTVHFCWIRPIVVPGGAAISICCKNHGNEQSVMGRFMWITSFLSKFANFITTDRMRQQQSRVQQILSSSTRYNLSNTEWKKASVVITKRWRAKWVYIHFVQNCFWLNSGLFFRIFLWPSIVLRLLL